jgi:hypothetical protein
MTSIGFPLMAAYSGFDCSRPILTTRSTTELTGRVRSYTAVGGSQAFFLLNIPSAGGTNGQEIIAFNTNSLTNYWTVTYGTGGSLRLRAYSDYDAGTVKYDSGAVAFLVDGKDLRVSLSISDSGGTVTAILATLEAGQTVGAASTGTFSSIAGRFTGVTVSPRGVFPSMSIGHISIHSTIRSIYDLRDELNAYSGETATDRIMRLCEESNIEFVGTNTAMSTVMGPQKSLMFTDLIKECERSDGGILFEPRTCLGIGFIARGLIGASARGLHYAGLSQFYLYYEELSDQLAPKFDDSLVVNDMTVTRTGGSSYQCTQYNGPMGITKVGQYDSSGEYSLATDDQCQRMAEWLVNIGTAPESRFPSIPVIARPAPSDADPEFVSGVILIGIGDRLDIVTPPTWVSYEDAKQLVVGMTERLDDYEHNLSIVTAPWSPWDVGAWQAARYGTSTATLSTGINSTATSLSIASAYPYWTVTAGFLPIDIMIGGERMTVSAISGATSPQAFTATRSVNRVVKAHLAGAIVELADNQRYGM